MKKIFEKVSKSIDVKGEVVLKQYKGGCPLDMLDETLNTFYDNILENIYY